MVVVAVVAVIAEVGRLVVLEAGIGVLSFAEALEDQACSRNRGKGIR